MIKKTLQILFFMYNSHHTATAIRINLLILGTTMKAIEIKNASKIDSNIIAASIPMSKPEPKN